MLQRQGPYKVMEINDSLKFYQVNKTKLETIRDKCDWYITSKQNPQRPPFILGVMWPKPTGIGYSGQRSSSNLCVEMQKKNTTKNWKYGRVKCMHGVNRRQAPVHPRIPMCMCVCDAHGSEPSHEILVQTAKLIHVVSRQTASRGLVNCRELVMDAIPLGWCGWSTNVVACSGVATLRRLR